MIATVVFSDLKGSTALGERFDAETLRRVLGRYFDEMRRVLEGRGGTIVKIIGDAIVTVFGLGEEPAGPALRAVEAVGEAEVVLAALNEELEATWGVRLVNRTGVATGEIVVGEESGGHRVYTGPVMAVAETMEQNAPPLEALLSVETHRLVAEYVEAVPIDPVTPKGGGDPVPAVHLRRVVTLEPGGGARTGDAVACDECGTENPASARRCAGCGRVLADAGEETRRTVTVVFADPKPRTADGFDLSPGTLKEVMSRYFAVMRPILERHGGTVETFIGDAVMAVFGLPVRHEDDALRAVRAAAEMRDALPGINAGLLEAFGVTMASPIGVNTGRVVAGDAALGQRLVTGDAVNVAARLEQAAPAGEVFLGPQTHRLVEAAVVAESVEPLTLKGKAEPVPAFRLVEVRAASASGRRFDLPMVGRDAEMAAAWSSFEETGRIASCTLLSIVGDAGVGKTRVTEEFLTAAGARARVLRGRCLPYGDGITFWPLVEALREAAGIREDDGPATARERVEALVGDAAVAERLSSMAGLTEAQFPVPEYFWAVERFVGILSGGDLLVVLIDDVHWAEPTLLDLVDHLLDSVSGHPVLLLCTARRMLLEERPDWATGEHRTRIVLDPLDPGAVGTMIANYLGTAGVDEAIVGRVAEAAQGNPLFVEQFLTMLVEEGRLRVDDDDVTVVGDLADIAVPPSIEALLSARLDRLGESERHVAGRASVIGRQFARNAVEHLIEPDRRPQVAGDLGSLGQKHLILPGVDAEEESYLFEHLLIRDAAYEGLLKQSRAVLHERFVDWADRINRERGRETEFEEILGYHLEQAYRYWSELGPLDEHGVELGRRASARLASAGERALARGDMPAAARLLGRAAGTLQSAHPGRPGLLLRAGEARFESGDFDGARETIGAAADAAEAAGDRGTAAGAEIERLRMGYLTGAVADAGEVADTVRALLPDLEAANGHAGLARAWRLLASIDLAACRWGEAEQAAWQMIEHARAAGDHTMEMRVLPILTLFLQKGPTPVGEAIEGCRQILDAVASDRRAAAMATRQLAQLHAMRGEFGEARSLYRGSRRTLEELGWAFDAAIVSLDSGPIEMLAGEPALAEAELQRDCEALRAMGDRNFLGLTAALLGEARYRQGDFDGAREAVASAEEGAAPDDLGAQVLWRTVKAKLVAREGDADAARALVGEALRLIESTEDPSGQAEVLVDAAEVARLAGEPRRAAALLRRALGKHLEKGNLAGAHRVERLLAESI